VIPLIPFFFVMLSHTLNSYRKNVLYILMGLVCFSALTSGALAAKIIIHGKQSGYNIRTAGNTLNEILGEKNHRYLITGPAEIWPFIEGDKDVLIIDKTRTGKDFQILEPVIDSIDNVVINRDYSRYDWEGRFRQHFPGANLDMINMTGEGEEFLKLLEISPKHPAAE